MIGPRCERHRRDPKVAPDGGRPVLAAGIRGTIPIRFSEPRRGDTNIVGNHSAVKVPRDLHSPTHREAFFDCSFCRPSGAQNCILGPNPGFRFSRFAGYAPSGATFGSRLRRLYLTGSGFCSSWKLGLLVGQQARSAESMNSDLSKRISTFRQSAKKTLRYNLYRSILTGKCCGAGRPAMCLPTSCRGTPPAPSSGGRS
jgi:hypothetical protein